MPHCLSQRAFPPSSLVSHNYLLGFGTEYPLQKTTGHIILQGLGKKVRGLIPVVSKRLEEIHGSNGLKFIVSNNSRRYFGNFHQLKLLITCKIPLKLVFFRTEVERNRAETLLGQEFTYERSVERMAVATEQVDLVLHELINNFKKNSMPYFNSPTFLQNLLQAELDKTCTKAAAHTFIYE